MKSFKDFFESMLLEDKVTLLVNKQGEKAFTAYKSDKGSNKPDLENGESVIKELAGWTQKYLQWLVNRYVENQFSLEDKARVITAMDNFSKYSKKLELKDINQYKNLSDLEDKLDQFNDNDAKSNRQLDKEKEAALFKEKKAKLFYQDDKIKVIIPNTEEASCYFGTGTKWCTAATNSNNLFDTYNKQGKLYIVIAGGKKYQFHFTTAQFMNDADRPVDIAELVGKFPTLKDIFSDLARKGKKKILPLIKDPTGSEILTGIDSDMDYLLGINELDRDTQEAIVGRHPTMTPLIKAPKLFDRDIILAAMVENSYFADEWISKYGMKEADLLDIVKNQEPKGTSSRWRSVRTTDHIINSFASKIKEPSAEILNIAATKSLVSVETVEKFQDKISAEALLQFSLDNAHEVVKSNLPPKYKERAKWVVYGKGHKF